jgi:hypothetical protein
MSVGQVHLVVGQNQVKTHSFRQRALTYNAPVQQQPSRPTKIQQDRHGKLRLRRGRSVVVVVIFRQPSEATPIAACPNLACCWMDHQRGRRYRRSRRRGCREGITATATAPAPAAFLLCVRPTRLGHY